MIRNSFRYQLLQYLLVIVLFMNIFAQNSEDIIIKIEEMKIGDIDIANHKPGDVAVCKTYFLGSGGYMCTFFRLEGDKLRQFKASYMTEEVYDQACCHWENDTTVAIRLLNSVTLEEQKFQVWGSGPTTGMSVDD